MHIIDLIEITVCSGNGGNGAVAFRREKFIPNGGPAGGDGGRGGSVILEATNELQTLLDFQYKHRFHADDGQNGRIKKMNGRKGDDLIVKVPLGTIIKNKQTDKIIADLTEHKQQFIVARGGKGGRGNTHFATATYQTPRYAEPGTPGEEKELLLELKTIADVGLVGLPNAGKSSLLAVISAAKPKIANYPFTTLSPNLGAVKFPDGDGFMVADIPGIIEGAHDGIGLGLEFLRHIERTRLLLHLVDLSATDPIENFKTIQEELKEYPADLENKPLLLVLNKIDMCDQDYIDDYIEQFRLLTDGDILTISALAQLGIKPLIYKVQELLKDIPKLTPFVIETEEEELTIDDDYKIEYLDGIYYVESDYLYRLISLSDLMDERALNRLQKKMKNIGLFESLVSQGCKVGDTVKVGDFEFEYL